LITILYNTLLESAPYIVLGFLIAGIIRFWVPSNVLQNHLGGRTPSALLKSVGVGCILPLCSCGTIPLGIGLFKSGAAIGNMLAFMTSTPILSPVLITISLKLLGWKLTVTLVLAAIIGSFFTGFVGNRLFKNPEKKSQLETKKIVTIESLRPLNQKGKLPKLLNGHFLNWEPM
jgi:uncharacterized membrane protein YraQ (UPF0718 family)